jgi:hypothetical protein
MLPKQVFHAWADPRLLTQVKDFALRASEKAVTASRRSWQKNKITEII